jgi:hypothetical protein
MNEADIELRSRSGTPADGLEQGEDASHTEFTLSRVDGGREAWLVLASCFVLEAMVWGKYLTIQKPPIIPFATDGEHGAVGFPLAFGVFQEYYTTHEFMSGDVSSIAAIGTTSSVCLLYAHDFLQS